MKDKPREKALEILKRAEEGAFADALLDEARQNFDSRDRAFVTEIVYGVLRNRARLDWVLNRFSASRFLKRTHGPETFCVSLPTRCSSWTRCLSAPR